MLKISKTQQSIQGDNSINKKRINSKHEYDQLNNALDVIDSFDMSLKLSADNAFKAKEELKLQAFNFRHGFPPNLRHLFWIRLLSTNKTPKDVHFENFMKNPVLNEFNQDVIKADVNRTRSYIPHFREEKSRYEMELLLTYFCKLTNISYKQGMNEILAPFYSLKSSEVDLFQVCNLFTAFIDKFLPSMFDSLDFPRLHCSFVLFKHLLFYHHPKLATYLDIHGVAPELYVTPWFLTIFSSKNSLIHTMCFWDFYISYGDEKFYLYIGLACLLINSNLILSTEGIRIPELINSINFCDFETINKIWDLAIELQSQTPSSFGKQLDYLPVNPIESMFIIDDLETQPFMHLTPEEILSSQYNLPPQYTHKGQIPKNWKFLFLDFRPTTEYFSGRLPMTQRYDIQTEWESDFSDFFKRINGPLEYPQAKGMSTFDSGSTLAQLDTDVINSIDCIKSGPLTTEILKTRRNSASNKKNGSSLLRLLDSSSTTKREKTTSDKSDLNNDKNFRFDFGNAHSKNISVHCCMIFNSSKVGLNYSIAGRIIRNLNLRWISTVKGNFEACHQLCIELGLELVDHDIQNCPACKSSQLHTSQDVIFQYPNESANNSFYSSKTSATHNAEEHIEDLKIMADGLKQLHTPIALNFRRTLDQHIFNKQENNTMPRSNSDESYASNYTRSPVDEDNFPHCYLFGYFLWNTWIGTPEAEYIDYYPCQIELMMIPIDRFNIFLKFDPNKSFASKPKFTISSKILGLHKLHHHMYSSNELDKYSYLESFNSNTSSTIKEKNNYKVPYSLSMELGDFDKLPGYMILLPEHIILTTEPIRANQQDIVNLKSYNFLDIAKLAKHSTTYTSLGRSESFISASQFTSRSSDAESTYSKSDISYEIRLAQEFVKVLGIFSITHLAKITSTKNIQSKRYFYFSAGTNAKGFEGKELTPWIKLIFPNKHLSDSSTSKINALVKAWKTRRGVK